jgi:hypothetical protein
VLHPLIEIPRGVFVRAAPYTYHLRDRVRENVIAPHRMLNLVSTSPTFAFAVVFPTFAFAVVFPTDTALGAGAVFFGYVFCFLPDKARITVVVLQLNIIAACSIVLPLLTNLRIFWLRLARWDCVRDWLYFLLLIDFLFIDIRILMCQ